MKKFRINYTSDTHGYLYPTDYTGRAEKPMGLFKLSAAGKIKSHHNSHSVNSLSGFKIKGA